MEVVYDLLRADREGNWLLHLDAFQRSLHQFAAWDCTNYLRWGSVYLEDMRLLQETSKTFYENFMEGSFSIKDGFQKFTAVGGDQTLEQTINLATKRSDSVIGNVRKKHFIAKWDMIYHEIVSIKTVYSEYAMVFDSSFEGWQHHEFSPKFTKRIEDQIQKVLNFIEEKGSPVSKYCTTILQNVVSKQLMTEEIRENLLNFTDLGKKKYCQFRSKVLLEKSTRISTSIHRLNLKNMTTVSKTETPTTHKTMLKEFSLNDRKLEIARDRGLTIDILVNYDIVHSPLLFRNGHMTKPDKSKLLNELEKVLSSEDYCYENKHKSALQLILCLTFVA